MKISDMWRDTLNLFRRQDLPVERIGQDGLPVFRSFERAVTVAGKDPLTIRGKLSGGNLYGYIISINISGALHPHDPQFESGAVGDINKNPAFLPAINILRRDFPPSVVEAMRRTGVGSRAMEKTDAKDGVVFRNDSDGIWLQVRVNPKDDYWRIENYVPVKTGQVLKLFEELSRRVDSLLPVLQASVDENKHLYPDANDHMAAAEHTGNLDLRRMLTAMEPGLGVGIHDSSDAVDLARLAEAKGMDAPVFAVRGEDGKPQPFELVKKTL